MENWNLPRLPTLDWSQFLSAAGLSWLASWLLFFVFAPPLQWLLGNWKLASGIAYVLSWIAMIGIFRLYVVLAETQKKTSSKE